jgi:hypothetical protein
MSDLQQLQGGAKVLIAHYPLISTSIGCTWLIM